MGTARQLRFALGTLMSVKFWAREVADLAVSSLTGRVGVGLD